MLFFFFFRACSHLSGLLQTHLVSFPSSHFSSRLLWICYLQVLSVSAWDSDYLVCFLLGITVPAVLFSITFPTFPCDDAWPLVQLFFLAFWNTCLRWEMRHGLCSLASRWLSERDLQSSHLGGIIVRHHSSTCILFYFTCTMYLASHSLLNTWSALLECMRRLGVSAAFCRFRCFVNSMFELFHCYESIVSWPLSSFSQCTSVDSIY